jgi:putative DNA primase/helicase
MTDLTRDDLIVIEHPGQDEALPTATVELVNAASVKPEPVSWLWDGWLARGKLHILAGRPGCGKTTLALALAATATIAGRWPDGTRCQQAGDIVVWSGEDDPADTLVPRLLASGADLRRVHFVGDVKGAGGARPFDPARDMQLLLAALERVRPAMLVIDPVVSAVAADSHKNTEVRRALQPLVDLAARVGCALVGITHLSKGTAGRDPSERVTGSIAFSALARVVLLAAKRENPEPGEAPRLLVRSKSNIGDDSGGVGYDLEQVEAAPGVFASRVLWAGAIDGNARELLAQAEAAPDAGEPDGALGDAAGFLRALLSDGPVPSKQVRADADGAGHSWATIRRAAAKLGVEARKEGGALRARRQTAVGLGASC